MLDQTLLNHPANKMALEALRKAGVTPSDQWYPLTQLVMNRLEAMPRGDGTPAEMNELLAQTQMVDGPDQTLALLVEDQEQLNEDLANASDPKKVLAKHLDQMMVGLRRAENPASDLVDNLRCGLAVVYPSFDPPRL